MPVDLSPALNKLIADAKAKAGDGLTVAEARALLVDFTSETMQLVQVALIGPGVDKKQLVMAWAQRFVDELSPLVSFLPLPWWLAWAKPFIAEFVRQHLVAEVSALIEVLYARFIKFQAPPLPPNA